MWFGFSIKNISFATPIVEKSLSPTYGFIYSDQYARRAYYSTRKYMQTVQNMHNMQAVKTVHNDRLLKKSISLVTPLLKKSLSPPFRFLYSD